MRMVGTRRTRVFIVVAALIAIAQLAGVGTASAKPPTFAAKLLGPVQIDKDDPSVGTVHALYVCDEAPAWHLWVSLKQNATGTVDPALAEEGSSGVADAWIQSHPVDFVCDSKWHEQKF